MTEHSPTCRPGLRVAHGVLLALGVGCTAELAAPPERNPEPGLVPIAPLELEGDGPALRLQAAPADPTYQPSYPNPELAERMTVLVGPRGELDARCEGPNGPFACRTHPFHTLIERLGGGRARVEVRDLFGKVVAVGSGVADSEAGPTGNEGDPDDFASGADGNPDADGDAEDNAGTSLQHSPGTAGYTGEVGVEVDVLDGWFATPGITLDAGAPITARQSSADDQYLSVSFTGESQAYIALKAPADGPASFEYSQSTRTAPEGLEFRLHVAGGTQDYFAQHDGELGGALVYMAREESSDGTTHRLRADAVWPDGSWARVVLRYNATSSAPPGSMEFVEVGPEPSWSEFADSCARPEAKQQFCAGVDAELATIFETRGLDADYALDCAALPDHPTEAPARWAPSAEVLIRSPLCSGILGPVAAQVLALTGEDPCTVALARTWQDHGGNELMLDNVCKDTTPIVLDLDGDGVELSDPEGGVAFDLLATGQAVQASWPVGDDDAFLVIDLDGDGLVADAEELFGEWTAGRRYTDGFEALAAFDENGDGAVDRDDPAWRHLGVWHDADRDGVSGPNEMRSLEQVGVASLAVRPMRVEGAAAVDAHGNRLPLVAPFAFADGRRGDMVDVFLRYRPLASEPVDGTEIGVRPGQAPSMQTAPSVEALQCGPAGR